MRKTPGNSDGACGIAPTTPDEQVHIGLSRREVERVRAEIACLAGCPPGLAVPVVAEL